VCAETVRRWRKAIGITPTTEGTTRQTAQSPHLERMRKAARPRLSDPARAEKIRKAKLGKSRPPESGRAHLGRKASQESRRRMSAAHRASGTGGASPGKPWTDEDQAARSLTPQEAARGTGATLKAAWERRKKLRVNPAG
jgi:anti-sigma factor RsiW